jgi:hypothetical protein
MPIEPPQPLQIATVLEDQLAQLRALISAYPNQPEYPTAADLLAQSIEHLKAAAAKQQSAR